MNIINLKRKNQDNPLDIFMKWLEPDIIKINIVFKFDFKVCS